MEVQHKAARIADGQEVGILRPVLPLAVAQAILGHPSGRGRRPCPRRAFHLSCWAGGRAAPCRPLPGSRSGSSPRSPGSGARPASDAYCIRPPPSPSAAQRTRRSSRPSRSNLIPPKAGRERQGIGRSAGRGGHGESDGGGPVGVAKVRQQRRHFVGGESASLAALVDVGVVALQAGQRVLRRAAFALKPSGELAGRRGRSVSGIAGSGPWGVSSSASKPGDRRLDPCRSQVSGPLRAGPQEYVAYPLADYGDLSGRHLPLPKVRHEVRHVSADDLVFGVQHQQRRNAAGAVRVK